MNCCHKTEVKFSTGFRVTGGLLLRNLRSVSGSRFSLRRIAVKQLDLAQKLED